MYNRQVQNFYLRKQLWCLKVVKENFARLSVLHNYSAAES